MGKNKKMENPNLVDIIIDNYMGSKFEPTADENKYLEDGELLFSAQLDEAYHFRNLFEYLRVANIDANMYFTKDKIEYACSNGIETILNRFTILTVDIPYYFNSIYKDVIVGINLGTFARTTKNIGKKDAFKIFMVKGINKLFYEIITTTNSGMTTQSTGSIDVKEVEEVPMTFPTDSDAPPIQSMPISIFCHNCSVLSNLRCNKVKISAFKNGMKFEGIDNYNQVQNVQRFYPSKMKLVDNKIDHTLGVDIFKNAADADIGELVQSVKVPMLTIKWISKLSNISPHGGRLLVYAEDNKPIKLSGMIGFYGNFEIFIKNESVN